jgi:hypothetical protein
VSSGVELRLLLRVLITCEPPVFFSSQVCLFGLLCVSLLQEYAVPWLRQLVADFLPRRPRFAPGSIHVGFLADKVSLGRGFLRVLLFSPVSIISPRLSTLIYHLRDKQQVR